MHGLSSITTTFVGRCRSSTKISDIRLSCSQFFHSLESSTGQNKDKTRPSRFKRCSRSEPTLNIDLKHRICNVNTRRKNLTSTVEKPVQKCIKHNDETPMNHYTINIYLNSVPNQHATFEESKMLPTDFSVDKLTKNIACNSALIEGFLKNKDLDKDRDREFIEEKLAGFWRNVFENSKTNDDKLSNKEKSKENVENFDFSETPLERIAFKRSEDVLNNIPEEELKCDNQFINKTDNNINNNIRVDKDLQPEEKLEESFSKTPIPFYERGFYDSRTVRPRKIISSAPQVRRKLTQDVEESNKRVENLVKLSSQNHTKESSFNKIITYCKKLFKGEIEQTVEENEIEKETLNDSSVKQKYILGKINYFSKRNYSSYTRYNENNQGKKANQKFYCNIERSRHCLAGVSMERPNKSKNIQQNKKGDINLAKNASKLMSSFNQPIKPIKTTGKISLTNLNLSKFLLNNKSKKTHLKHTRSKSENSRKYWSNIKIKRVKSEETQSLIPNKLMTKKDFLKKMGKSEEDIKKITQEKICYIKILKKGKRFDKDKSELKPSRLFSTRFKRIPTKDLEMKLTNVNLQDLPSKLNERKSDEASSDDYDILKSPIFEKKLKEDDLKSHVEGISIKPKKMSKSEGFILGKKRRKAFVVSKRTICTESKNKTTRGKCAKGKKLTKKKECLPTHKKLAKRSTCGPRKPLKYAQLICREEIPPPVCPKEPSVTDIEGLFDKSREKQFKNYFDVGGYKNKEYYLYKKSSFYDLNEAVSSSRIEQPKSGAKPR